MINHYQYLIQLSMDIFAWISAALPGPRAWVWPFAPPPGGQRRTWMRVSHGRGAWIDGSGAYLGEKWWANMGIPSGNLT